MYYGRSLLTYFGAPLVGARLWGERDINHVEQQLYRQIYNATGDISGRTIANVTQDQCQAWHSISKLAERAKLLSHRQNTLRDPPINQTTQRTHIYVPRIMAETMWATTRGRTVAQYGVRE